jgi:putative radical SAM enzyme (TIGR03279 family)
MKIKSVAQGSIASRLNILAGDELLRIDDHSIRDAIDYRFFSAEERLELEIRSPSGKTRTISLRKQPDQDLGLEFSPVRYKSCKNNCIFCFVHQLPKGLRKALYFKDEDFRLSFLHGNFITLTNTSGQDLKRIIEQRLSPLYTSVHTTDEKLRKEILGNKQIPDIMPQMETLAQAGIEMHVQIVLCPGINDGEHLEKSVRDLSALYPQVKSLALVPVGLTKFRSKLPRIRPVGKVYSRKIIEMVDEWQRDFRKKLGSGFVYAADEFYAKARLGIPAKRYYDEFYQIENGVGMLRQLLDDFGSKRKLLRKRLRKNLRITLVTGVSASHVIGELVQKYLTTIPGLKVQLVCVKNDFFGHSVTVTGLLTGGEIIAALRGRGNLGDLILLPPNCINQDGLFLDDLRPKDIERECGLEVRVGSCSLVESVYRAVKKFTPKRRDA